MRQPLHVIVSCLFSPRKVLIRSADLELVLFRKLATAALPRPCRFMLMMCSVKRHFYLHQRPTIVQEKKGSTPGVAAACKHHQGCALERTEGKYRCTERMRETARPAVIASWSRPQPSRPPWPCLPAKQDFSITANERWTYLLVCVSSTVLFLLLPYNFLCLISLCSYVYKSP